MPSNKPKKRSLFLIHHSDSVANETMGDSFIQRHIGPRSEDVPKMLATLGYSSLTAFIDDVIPKNIRMENELKIGQGITEREVLLELKETSRKNKVFKQFIGMGYSDCMTPSVILS